MTWCCWKWRLSWRGNLKLRTHVFWSWKAKGSKSLLLQHFLIYFLRTSSAKPSKTFSSLYPEEGESLSSYASLITINFLGSSNSELHSLNNRLAMTISAIAKLSKIWNSTRFPTNMKLYNSLVLSILLYGSESWLLIAEITKRVRTFETSI